MIWRREGGGGVKWRYYFNENVKAAAPDDAYVVNTKWEKI